MTKKETKILALLLCIFLAPTGFHRYVLKNYHGIWFLPLFHFSCIYLWLGNYDIKHLASVTAITFFIFYLLDIVLISTNRLKANFDFHPFLGFLLFIPSSILLDLCFILIAKHFNYGGLFY